NNCGRRHGVTGRDRPACTHMRLPASPATRSGVAIICKMARDVLEPHEVTLHGNRVTYRTAGDGPVLLLLHGIANSSQTWEPVASRLKRNFRLLAPDLLGHGASATPRGDYSLGAHATGVRDILTALGHDHVTVVGHSLGGGIAMQFAYQFPERCE